jgi:hypothetical protein
MPGCVKLDRSDLRTSAETTLIRPKPGRDELPIFRGNDRNGDLVCSGCDAVLFAATTPEFFYRILSPRRRLTVQCPECGAYSAIPAPADDDGK